MAKPTESTEAESAKPVEIPHSIGVRQLADLIEVSAIDIIKQLMRNGIIANINQVVDYESAASIAATLGYEPHQKPKTTEEAVAVISAIKKHRQLDVEGPNALQPRPPIVAVMGHVDHGKTRLLDVIRQTNVMDSEAGAITQHIGAYQVTVNEQKVTFLDTPGHEAFTAMRARGAQVADIAILVVAADDGVMPQTIEALDHARAASVPIVVAINKIDKPEANPDRVKQQLSEANLLVEDWGGDTVCISISAKEKEGISDLLENLLVVAEVEDLKADPSQLATGVVIESEMDKSKGPLATVLVHSGTLMVGDITTAGITWGRVKAMFNDIGKRVRKAGPAMPVEILGLNVVPQVGDILTAVIDERQAQALIEKHKHETEPESALLSRSVSLYNLFDQIRTGRMKELNAILKTDVQGSIEPLRGSLERLGTDEVKVRIIRSAAGNVTESDVMLATASKGLILGFGVSADLGARRLAEIENIDIRFYDVIYNLVADVEKALKGMLEPTIVDVVEGHAEVKAVFSLGKSGKVAGVYVTDGKISRNSTVRVRRGKQILHEANVNSLRRFKDDIKETTAGYECGVGVMGFNNFETGDVLEFYHKEKSE